MKTHLFSFIALAFCGVAWAHSGHDQPQKAHLKFKEGSVHAHVTWLVGPQSPNESKLQIEWRNGETHGPMGAPGEFRVSLWMPETKDHPGHGSSPTRLQQVLDQKGLPVLGVYEVSRMYFVMGGTWYVNVTLALADGVEETQTLHVEVRGGSHH